MPSRHDARCSTTPGDAAANPPDITLAFWPARMWCRLPRARRAVSYRWPHSGASRVREDGDVFDDLLEANARYREQFHDAGLRGTAAKGLAVLTCIDSRIDPLSMLGLHAGDAKIIRNAGARATDDALRSLVLAVNLLGVTRLCVVQHTDCAMVGRTDDDIRARLADERGVDATGWEFLATRDQEATLDADLARIAACPLLPSTLDVGGFVFDVRTGALRQLR